MPFTPDGKRNTVHPRTGRHPNQVPLATAAVLPTAVGAHRRSGWRSCVLSAKKRSAHAPGAGGGDKVERAEQGEAAAAAAAAAADDDECFVGGSARARPVCVTAAADGEGLVGEWRQRRNARGFFSRHHYRQVPIAAAAELPSAPPAGEMASVTAAQPAGKRAPPHRSISAPAGWATAHLRVWTSPLPPPEQCRRWPCEAKAAGQDGWTISPPDGRLGQRVDGAGGELDGGASFLSGAAPPSGVDAARLNRADGVPWFCGDPRFAGVRGAAVQQRTALCRCRRNRPLRTAAAGARREQRRVRGSREASSVSDPASMMRGANAKKRKAPATAKGKSKESSSLAGEQKDPDAKRCKTEGAEEEEEESPVKPNSE
uniref:Uncharacterized protein n=1 Tax=Setaria viridis TaxID=4556 RepID=A0A4U6UA33_SETVI|nr:hypothetical protein SEVIR_6G237400v2 [Setaria viridis]